ncbi:methyltransferase [Sorangium sp. So ce429]
MSESSSPAVLPAPLVVYQLAIGHYRSSALALVAKLGVADLIAAGRRNVDDLASATSTQPQALRRVLRLLASVDVLREDDAGDFELTAAGQLLRSDVPGSMKALVATFAGPPIQESWRELEYCVRTGQPAFKKDDPNADWTTRFSADPETAENFDKAMATGTALAAPAVARAYDFSSFKTIVDIGGGNGALLAAILSAHPQLRGTLFERPDVLERARGALASSPLQSRIDLAPGSFFEAVPAGLDAYLLKHVIHDWSDADACAILKVCRRAMPTHAKLLLVEGIYPRRVEPSLEAQGATANDVNMLVCTGGRQRSEAEFRELLEAASFQLTRIVPASVGACVIEGVPC